MTRSTSFTHFWIFGIQLMKSASGKRPPHEAHGPGKEAIRPQQRCLGKSRKEGAHELLHRKAFNNSAKFRQTFSHSCSSVLNILFIFAITWHGVNFANVDDFVWIFSNLYILSGEEQHLLNNFSTFLGFRNEYF